MINNKYSKWYFNIVSTAKSRILDGYGEKHHIIPKSLGGSNNVDNLVKLTAKEHYICHLLLTKIVVGEQLTKMKYALFMMAVVKNKSQLSRHQISSRMYEKLRLAKSDMMKNHIPWNKGIPHSTETRTKISIAGMHRKQSIDTIAKRVSKITGKTRTEEQKATMAEAQRGRTLSDEHKLKLAIAATARKTPSRRKGDTELPGPTAMDWIIDGVPVTSLRKWCLTNNVNYASLHAAYKGGRSFKGIVVTKVS